MPIRSATYSGAAPVTAPSPPALAGESAAIRRTRAALDDSLSRPVLLLVEEGLEPSAIARFVHDRGRPGAPFVSIDCAYPDPVQLERSMLGSTSRRGRELELLGPAAAVLAAPGGTVFLEHAGELPFAVQRRLARLLRDGEAIVDGRGRLRFDACVMASATPQITAETREGRFREDLLRRLGATIPVPALRARREDLPAIIHAVASELASELRLADTPRFTQAALTVLSSLPWSGNVTELRAVVSRILASAPDPVVRQEDVLRTATVERLVAGIAPGVSLREARRRFEREYIAAVLEQHDWRMPEAARTLGLERANLYRKARQLGISRAPRASATATSRRTAHK
jgi:DNA-binding NtrC family response regulator